MQKKRKKSKKTGVTGPSSDGDNTESNGQQDTRAHIPFIPVSTLQEIGHILEIPGQEISAEKLTTSQSSSSSADVVDAE